MAFTRIRELPDSSGVRNPLTQDELVIEQDITRKINPLEFLRTGVPQLDTTTTITGVDLIPISQSNVTKNLTVQNLLNYINNNDNNPKIYNSVYVSIGGSDVIDSTERGRRIETPFATIKKAVAYIAAQTPSASSPWTIFLKNGDYTEVNPIYLPPHTSLIGDNLRRTTIRPSNPTYDIFWVNNACYIWGVTFRGHRAPSAAVAFPLYSGTQGQYTNGAAQVSVAYNTANYTISAPGSKPPISISPYVQGCTSYAVASDADQNTGFGGTANDAGCGMRIDGSLVNSSIRSMVLDSFTQVNQGGKGIHIINQGYAQLVSIFSVCTTEGVLCESGGTCSISTSNCTFGLSGLVAKGGSSSSILQGTFRGLTTGTDANIRDVITIDTLTGGGTYATVPYSGMFFTIGAVYNPAGGTGGLTESAVNPGSTNGNRTQLFYINTPPSLVGGQYKITLDNGIEATLAGYVGQTVYFYARSMVETGGHTFEYMGTGTRMDRSLPAFGGIVNSNNEVAFDAKNDRYDTNTVSYDPAVVYYTSSNELGNFNVGPNFQILQSTGTIAGDTFKRAIITLVTPLTIALE
jgi:hypothetical protein